MEERKPHTPLDAERRKRFEILERMRAPFRDTSPEEIEREVARAIEAVRREEQDHGIATGRDSGRGSRTMTLVLSNADVEALLTPRACIEPLEQAYREHALGQAANRARTHT